MHRLVVHARLEMQRIAFRDEDSARIGIAVTDLVPIAGRGAFPFGLLGERRRRKSDQRRGEGKCGAHHPPSAMMAAVTTTPMPVNAAPAFQPPHPE
jgi:hypothetical protein